MSLTRTGLAAATNTVLPWWLPSLALAACVAVALVFAPYPPLQDLTEWVYHGEILARLVRGLPVPEVWLSDHPVPNSLVQAVLGLLALVVPATLAAWILTFGLLAAGALLALALARRAPSEAPGALAVVLVVSFACHAMFWNGYVNYQLGLLLFMGWLLLPAGRRLEAGPILGFGLLTFFSHAAIFAAFGVLVAAEALAARRLRGAILGLVLPGLLGLWYVLAGAEADQPTSPAGGLLRALAHKAYTVTKIGPYHNFVFIDGDDGSRSPADYWAGVAASLIYAALILGAIGTGLWRAARHRSLPLAPLAAAALLFGISLALPPAARGIINPGERLMIPALLLLLVSLPLPGAPVRLAGVLGAPVLVASLLALAPPERDWWAPVHFRDMEAGGGAHALFRHRPTSFACKWEALVESAATGAVPRAPISFQTSLLRSPDREFYCPVPDRLAR